MYRMRSGMLMMLVMLLAMALAGCASTKRVYCKTLPGGNWECGGEIIWTFMKSSGQSYIDFYDYDVADISVDMSDSNVAIPAGSATVTIILKSGASVIGAQSFMVYVSSGQATFGSPSTVNAWLRNYSTADKVDFAINGVAISPHSGSNTFVAEAVDSGTVIAGASTSFYLDTGPQPPIDPY